jgi:hypothetical protein
MPLKGTIGNLCHRSIGRMPATATCLASTQALRSRRVSSASKSPDCVAAHQLDRCSSPARPVPTGQTHQSDRSGAAASPSSVLLSWLCGSTQGTQWFSGEPPETPRTRCSLRQSQLMTRLPRSSGSTLVLRLNQETIHDFILLFMPPCGPHLTPLATGPSNQATCLLHTWRPHRRRPFALVLHLHQHQLSRNLHLQYLAKNQSTQCCQSLITPGSDHTPVLEPHMVLTFLPFLLGNLPLY